MLFYEAIFGSRSLGTKERICAGRYAELSEKYETILLLHRQCDCQFAPACVCGVDPSALTYTLVALENGVIHIIVYLEMI
jgi:hypothetical protein